MESIKQERIALMLLFLNYGIYDYIPMHGLSSSDGTYPSCNYVGDFFLNKSSMRSRVLKPSSDMIQRAYSMLIVECRVRISSMSSKYAMPLFSNVIKKCYNLEFVST